MKRGNSFFGLKAFYFSESSVDLSTSEDRVNNSGVQFPLRTPFTGDLGMVSNRSSFLSQVRLICREIRFASCCSIFLDRPSLFRLRIAKQCLYQPPESRRITKGQTHLVFWVFIIANNHFLSTLLVLMWMIRKNSISPLFLSRPVSYNKQPCMSMYVGL